MKYALNNNGVLQDVIETRPDIIFQAAYAEKFIPVPEHVENGWFFDGQVFSAPPTVAKKSTRLITEVTMRQARLALLKAGLLDKVQAAISGIVDSTERTAAQIEWEYATVVKRDSPLIEAVAVQAGLTETQIDQMFIEASQL